MGRDFPFYFISNKSVLANKQDLAPLILIARLDRVGASMEI